MAQHDLDLISSAVQTDPYHSLDYGFSYNDFLESAEESWGGHVDYGIVPYVETRNNTALNQLDEVVATKSLGAFWLLHNFPEEASGMAMVAAFGDIDSTLFQFSLDGNSWTDGGFMKDDGIFPDVEYMLFMNFLYFNIYFTRRIAIGCFRKLIFLFFSLL
jgi:hypothetical protein